jgi:hypothetical protein
MIATTDPATALAALPIFGGNAPNAPNAQYGINVVGDVPVNQTADGVSLDDLWRELRDVFAIVSAERTALVNLMSYWHTETGSAVPQNISSPWFEETSELGVPKAAGTRRKHYCLGTPFAITTWPAD